MSRTHIIILISAIVLLFFVLEQVRRRQLREEYSWLWLLTAIGYFVLAVWPGFSGWMAHLIGTSNAAVAFTFLGLYFLIFISIQFSIQLSRLSTQNKDMAQQLAILDCELSQLSETPATSILADQTVEEEHEHAKRANDRSGRLVPGVDQHQPTG